MKTPSSAPKSPTKKLAVKRDTLRDLNPPDRVKKALKGGCLYTATRKKTLGG